jgi:hypothetical protein
LESSPHSNHGLLLLRNVDRRAVHATPPFGFYRLFMFVHHTKSGISFPVGFHVVPKLHLVTALLLGAELPVVVRGMKK